MARDSLTRLETFAGDLERALGDNLVSLVLYGSAARGDHHAKRSDINLLLVLRDARPATLRPIGRLIADWTRREPPPLIVTETGWRASADVFAMEIEDMRQAHRVVRGVDPFAGLETSAADLRTELEREARGKLLQLRSHFAAVESDGRALGQLLESSAGTFFVLFRALIRLKGSTLPRGADELVAKAAEIAGFQAQAFAWPLAQLSGRPARRLEPFDQAGEAYVEAIERLVECIDGLGQ
ncbi:MAG TPA: nucleotidyltransferase domain-containing protein [Gemmatimonadales bacterium]